jgi:hypothetical protein
MCNVRASTGTSALGATLRVGTDARLRLWSFWVMTGLVLALLILGGARAGEPGSDTWRSFASGFMARYCVSCHNDDGSGDVWRNYRLLAAVVRDSVPIACGVARSTAVRERRGCTSTAPRARQFPIGDGPRPTDDERDRLLRWIDANAPP